MSKSGLSLVVLVVLLGATGSHAGSNGIFLGKKSPVASATAESAAQSIASAAGAGLSSSSMAGSMMAGMSLGSPAATATVTSPPMFSFPTYPAVNDYSSGQCAGYAFCFATWNPPVVTEPDVMCPAGYELTNSQGTPICVQKSMSACPTGFDFSGKGDCCTVRSSGQCYANWDSCSGGAASAGSYMYSGDVGVGSICKGTSDYSAVVDGVQLVQVTSGSKWFDGSSSSSSSAGFNQGYSYGSSGSSSVAADDNSDTTNVQVIPSGQLVNLNGKLVHVGPIPAGVPLAGGSSSSSSSSGSSGSSSSSTDASGLTPAQQAALDALQRQAQQQGTYIPDQTAAGNGGSSSSSSSGGGGGSSSIDPNLPPPTMSGQQAALDVLQQQAQQQGTYIPGQDGSNSGQSAGSNPVNSFDLPPMTQPVTAGKRPKDGLLLTTVLLMLPKILLKGGPKLPSMSISFDVPKVVTDQLVGSKEVVASLANTKEDFLPKCFSKCCAPDAGVVCVPASTSVNYAKPAYICPPGCSFLDNSNKCLCSTGHFTPCLSTDTVCSWGEQPICVGSKSFFGIDACKFVGALQQHLPKVQCPYKSLARGLQYQQLG
ncbi:hypothetical protein OEZ86_007303 [Tetradesmus obliquus]|nr:hypothetical protein OEZ86_007303 [Tetradesmus obliquus]